MKKALLIILLTIIFLGNIQPVDAARVVCTKSRFNQFKTKALQTTVNYEFHKNPGEIYYFTITLSNLQPGVVAKFGFDEIKYEEGKDVYNTTTQLDGGTTYEVEFYVDEKNPCAGEYLYSKKITIPKYNPYSEMSECIEYEEFPLCNMWYQKDIESMNYFQLELDKYIESIKEKPPEKLDEEKEDLIDKLISFYKNNIIITGPLTALAVAGVGYYILKKYNNKRKRTKIKF